jgi:hypothetical protein
VVTTYVTNNDSQYHREGHIEGKPLCRICGIVGLMTDSGEVWLPVPGFEESHEVSSHGRMRYHAIVKPYISNTGYPRVAIAKKGRRVASVLLGPWPPGHHIHHKDGGRTNPRPENLEYVSPKAHSALTNAQGRILRGSHHPNAKLTEDDVRAIRAYPCTRRNERQWAVLAARYGVSIHTIRSVRERSSWKQVT